MSRKPAVLSLAADAVAAVSAVLSLYYNRVTKGVIQYQVPVNISSSVRALSLIIFLFLALSRAVD